MSEMYLVQDHASLRTYIEKALAEIEVIAKNVAYAFGGFILLLSLLYAVEQYALLHSLGFFLRTLSMAAVIAVGAIAVGTVLGFLFGIPRLLQQANANVATDKPGTDAERRAANISKTDKLLMTNTSLEEISDWLTKIIIGLGLVQFNTILGYIKIASVSSALYVTKGQLNSEDILKSNGVSDPVSVFFFALIVACVLFSCLFAYLETRTRLTLLFLGMEQVGSAPASEALEEAFKRPVASTEQHVPDGKFKSAIAVTLRQPLSDADRPMLAVARETLHNPIDIAGWAAVQARAGNLQAAEDALRDALQRDPANVDVLIRLAELRRLRQNREGFIDTVTEAFKKDPNNADAQSLATDALLDALYLPPPVGFQRAIELSDLLLRTPYVSDSFVQLRRACAFGQQYKHNIERGLNGEEAKKHALDAIRRVIMLSPDPNSPRGETYGTFLIHRPMKIPLKMISRSSRTLKVSAR